jgi:hypothetical protein
MRAAAELGFGRRKRGGEGSVAVNFAVNYLAVVVAAIVAIILGFIWFSPQTLGSRWTAYGLPATPARPGASAIVVGVVSALLNAWVLALLSLNLGGKTIGDGILLGVLVWLGFLATVTAAEYAFLNRPWSAWVINNIHHVVVQAVLAAIVTVWR